MAATAGALRPSPVAGQLALKWVPSEGHDGLRAASAFWRRDGLVEARVMRAAPDASGLATAGGHVPAVWPDTLLIAALIAVLAAGCLLIFLYLRRSSRRPKRVADHWQALAVMGELCPHGWQARITLYGWGAPVPDDAPPSRVPQVELRWELYEEEHGSVVAVRRAWAPTIEAALQTMVDGRRTDLALEQIEQATAEQGLEWEEG